MAREGYNESEVPIPPVIEEEDDDEGPPELPDNDD
jgi:hypothetical protein